MQLLLTHGASSNRNAPLLVALDRALAQHGIRVTRYDLSYRQARPHGPPRPNEAERDRAGLREALQDIRKEARGPVWLGGHSYGGRQASMLAAEEPELVAGLLLLSYPLHPPGKPNQLRTAHLAKLQKPDGSWVNDNDRWMEGEPPLVTGYALMALGHCKAKN